jgi:hypothetical protein
MTMPNSNCHANANPTANRVLGLLAEHGVEASAAAEVLQDLFRALGRISSTQFGTGRMSLEFVTDRMMSASFDAAAMLASLGQEGEDLEFRVLLRTPEDRRLSAAAHEIGHCILAQLLLGPESVKWASVDPDDTTPDNMEGVTRLSDSLGFIQHFRRRPPEPMRASIAPKAFRLAVVTLGGGYAEAALYKDRLPSFGVDLLEARGLTSMFSVCGEEEAQFRKAHALAAQLVGATRPAIVAVARLLARLDRLTGEQVAEVAGTYLDAKAHRLIDGLLRGE